MNGPTLDTYWLNNMDNIISLVSSGKLVRKRIWLGGCSGIAVGAAGWAGGAAAMAETSQDIDPLLS